MPEAKRCLVLCTDSPSAIRLSVREGVKRHSKHIDITAHYVRDAFARKEVTLQYIPTNDKIADILTKPFPQLAFTKLINLTVLEAKVGMYISF